MYSPSFDEVAQYKEYDVIPVSKEIYADVKTWCSKDGYIDYICPQIYFSLDIIKKNSRQVQKLLSTGKYRRWRKVGKVQFLWL